MDALSIYAATKEQILESRRRTHVEWGRGLTLEEYVAREEMLDTKPHATEGKMTIWVLAPRSNPSTVDFFSSCETYHRESVTSSGPCVAYGIASVFTPERHRGKGYAHHLMRLLHFVLIKKELLPEFPRATWGEPPEVPEGLGKGTASALYSDVGQFYGKCNPGVGKEHSDRAWIVQNPCGTIWPASPSKQDWDEARIQWIGNGQLDEVWDEDSRLLVKEIQGSPTPAFSFLPSRGVARFLYERGKQFIPRDWKEDKWGARYVQDGGFSYATWALDPDRQGASTLLITRLRADETTFPVLLEAARKAARSLDIEQVEIWNLPSHLVERGKELGGETGPRDDHLPALAWYGEGQAEWKMNEKFCWC